MTVRETFSLNRQSEYFSRSELTKQIGYMPDKWILAIAKELLDNSLDHCEEIKREPEIVVRYTGDTLSVQDNGDGIAPETVVDMLDFDRRVSSREVTRGIARGAQGNACKTIVALPYVLNGGRGRTIIVSQGWRHTIDVTFDDLSGTPQITHKQTSESAQIGTFLQIDLAEYACKQEARECLNSIDLHTFCEKAAALNPHLHLTCELPDERYDWEPSSPCRKWTPANAEPASWHTEESFRRRVSAYIHKDRGAGTDRTATSFMREFAGMRRREALQKTLEETGLHRAKLSALLNGDGVDRTKVSRLLESMQKHGTTPAPSKLGCIGRSHLETVFASLGATTKLKYKKIVGETEGGMPFCVEAAFAESYDYAGMLITGCNYSPSIDKPVTRDLDEILTDQMVTDTDDVLMLLHVANVAPTFLDRGKSVFRVKEDSHLQHAIHSCTRSVTDDYRKRRKAEERDADRQEKRRERNARTRPEISLKDAIRKVMVESIHTVSGGGDCTFSARDHYYIVRHLIQEHTDEELKQSYFDRVVDDWELEKGLIEGRERSPRGYAVEPHTAKRIPLGTREVDEYEIPTWLYGTVLYFEKKGVLSRLEWGQIAEKYDALIIASEGYAVRAAKALIQAAQQGHKMKVLCFHDADPAGYNIARTLSEATGAHSYDIEVIDAGLHLEEAIELGLETEFFSRKKALPSSLTLTDLEIEYFGGEPKTITSSNGKRKTQWVKCRRVELNALSADPKTFVEWVESKLELHGVAKKLVPPPDVIATQANNDRGRLLREGIREAIELELDIESRVETIAGDLEGLVDIDAMPSSVAEWAETITSRHWTHCVRGLVVDGIDEIDANITDAVRETFGGQSS